MTIKPANILIMPGLHAANIASRLVGEEERKNYGPHQTGLKNSAQIVRVGASVTEIVTWHYLLLMTHLNQLVFLAQEIIN